MNIESLLEKTLPGLGYECVDVERTPTGILRIFIDKEGGVSVDDCAAVSHHLSRLFAVEDIDYKYLEISSPGLDRALKKEKDFQRFCQRRIKLQTRLPIEGRKRFKGILKTCVEGKITLECDQQTYVIDLNNIDHARLVPDL